MTDPTIKLTPEVVKVDAQNRVYATGAQVGGAGALVVVGEWIATESGWDGSLPTAVSAALVVLLGIVASWWKNRTGLKGQT